MTRAIKTPSEANLALQRAQAAYGAATTPAARQAAAAAGQAARAQGATTAGAQAIWQAQKAPVRVATPATPAAVAPVRVVTPASVQATDITGYNPNWFANLSPEVQARANVLRAEVGAPALVTDRPLFYEESVPRDFPTFEQLTPETQTTIVKAEEEAFAPFIAKWQEDERKLKEQRIVEDLEKEIDITKGLVDFAKQQSADIQGLVLMGLTTLLENIAQAEANITQHFQNQMGEDDPKLRIAINYIKEEVERQRVQMAESMNARGLSQSGIMLEMADRINRNELTQIQTLVAERIRDLQTQLNSSLKGFADARINAVSQFKALGVQAAVQGGQNVLETMRTQAQLAQQKGIADRAFVEEQRQFEVTAAQKDKQLKEEQRQFERTAAQREEQLKEEQRQFGVTAKQRDRQLDIAAQEARRVGTGVDAHIQRQEEKLEEREYKRTEALRTEFIEASRRFLAGLRAGTTTYEAAVQLINDTYRFYPPDFRLGLLNVVEEFRPAPAPVAPITPTRRTPQEIRAILRGIPHTPAAPSPLEGFDPVMWHNFITPTSPATPRRR